MAKRPKRGRLTTLVVVALLAVGFVAVSSYDTFNYERRVPLGSWLGRFTSPTGQRGALLLVLTPRKTTGTNGSYSTGGKLLFPGTAKLCITGAPGRWFVVDGSTDVNGPGFDAGLTPSSGPYDGPGFRAIRGVKQPNILAITSTLGTFGQDGYYLSSNLEATTFTMAKEGERQYRDSCAAIGAHY